jgi:hypothetical protein
MNQSTPYFQVRHNCLLYYELPEFAYRAAKCEFKTKAYSGNVTNGVKKRINKSVDLLILKSPKRYIFNPITKKRQPFTLNFITLTVSSIKLISSVEGYENLLKPFLRKLRSNCDSNVSYIWKCELQERGQIHYHITCNQFVHLEWIKNTWNNLQRQNRYLDHYAKLHKTFSPNSTDVHAVWKVKDIASYLSKYLSKTDKSQALKSKVWDCSKDLKIKRYSFIPNQDFIIKLNDLVKVGKLELVILEQCLIFKGKNILDLLERQDKILLKNHLL